MGRRALGKIQPDLTLEGHYLELEDLDAPLGDGPFSAARPLEVEVGSGKGLFMGSAALTSPEHNFLGIEISTRYAKYAAAQLAQHELKNAVMVRGDGMKLFVDHLQSEQLQAVHVYFPDPWWKQRHRSRRILNDAFIRLVENRLKVGGELHFWTDVHKYFDETLDRINAVTELDGPLEVSETSPEHDLDYRTHFERRMRINGEPVYRTRFIRM